MSASELTDASGLISFVTNSAKLGRFRIRLDQGLAAVTAVCAVISSGAEIEHLRIGSKNSSAGFCSGPADTEEKIQEALVGLRDVFVGRKLPATSSLELCGCNLGLSMFAQVASAALRAVASPESLVLRRIDFRDTHDDILITLPHECLHSVELQDCRIDAVPDFGCMIKSLRLNQNCINILDGGNHITRLRMLQSLSLVHAGLDAKSARILGALCAAGNCCLVSLHAFDISRNRLQDAGISALADGLAAGYIRTKRKCGELRSLDVSHNGIGTIGMQSISEGIIRRNPYLTRLAISWNKVGSAICCAGSEIREMRAAHCGMGSGDVKALCHAATKVRKLDVSRNALGFEALQAVAELLEGAGGIRGLSINDCGNSFDVAGVDALTSGIAHNKSLLTLRMCRNRHTTYRWTTRVLDSIPLSHPLLELSISHSMDRCGVGYALARFIARFSCIRSVRARACKIRGGEIAALADAVGKSRSIEVLSIGKNFFGDPGAICVAESIIAKNRSLRKLGVEEVGMTSGGATVLAKVVVERSREGWESRLRKIRVMEREHFETSVRIFREAQNAAGPWIRLDLG